MLLKPGRIGPTWLRRIDLCGGHNLPLRKCQVIQHEEIHQRNHHQQSQQWAEARLLEDEPVGNQDQERTDERKESEKRREKRVMPRKHAVISTKKWTPAYRSSHFTATRMRSNYVISSVSNAGSGTMRLRSRPLRLSVPISVRIFSTAAGSSISACIRAISSSPFTISSSTTACAWAT